MNNSSTFSFHNLLRLMVGVALGVLLLLSPWNHPPADGLDALRTLAVQVDGRKKPLDTVAKETIAQIHGSEHYQTRDGAQLDSLNAYLTLWFNTLNWNEEPFVLVNYRPLKESVDLDLDRKHFTFQELMSNQKLVTLVKTAHELEAQDARLNRNQKEALIVEDRLQLLFGTVGDRKLGIIPHPNEIKGTWAGLDTATTLYDAETVAPVLAQMGFLQQVLMRDSSSHEGAVAQLGQELQQTLRAFSPSIYPTPKTLGREVYFNQFHPFAKAWMLYTFAFSVMLLSIWVTRFNLYWTSVGLFLTGIAVQAYGFLLRMEIAGRPPVTNMYESVVWVGFGIAAIALTFELMTRARYYLLAAAPLAVACLILA
ncbi:MAG: cytochrome C biogenesis protein, partial [Cyanobacteria bacterium P01_F01_bin.42]